MSEAALKNQSGRNCSLYRLEAQDGSLRWLDGHWLRCLVSPGRWYRGLHQTKRRLGLEVRRPLVLENTGSCVTRSAQALAAAELVKKRMVADFLEILVLLIASKPIHSTFALSQALQAGSFPSHFCFLDRHRVHDDMARATLYCVLGSSFVPGEFVADFLPLFASVFPAPAPAPPAVVEFLRLFDAGGAGG